MHDRMPTGDVNNETRNIWLASSADWSVVLSAGPTCDFDCRDLGLRFVIFDVGTLPELERDPSLIAVAMLTPKTTELRATQPSQSSATNPKNFLIAPSMAHASQFPAFATR
jgi:hypothetical protein